MVPEGHSAVPLLAREGSRSGMSLSRELLHLARHTDSSEHFHNHLLAPQLPLPPPPPPQPSLLFDLLVILPALDVEQELHHPPIKGGRVWHIRVTSEPPASLLHLALDPFCIPIFCSELPDTAIPGTALPFGCQSSVRHRLNPQVRILHSGGLFLIPKDHWME